MNSIFIQLPIIILIAVVLYVIYKLLKKADLINKEVIFKGDERKEKNAFKKKVALWIVCIVMLMIISYIFGSVYFILQMKG